MLKTLSLILPVLLPSWRFFKTIEPSPRVQWTLLPVGGGNGDWHDFRPRPAHITPLQMLTRLFWNPAWNDTLFVLACAERIAEQPTPHSIHEITRRIQAHLREIPVETKGRKMQFRLVFVSRDDTGWCEDVLFVCDPVPIPVPAIPPPAP